MSGDVPPVVRLVDRLLPGGGRTVTVSWQAQGAGPREAVVEVSVGVDGGVAEKLRWYLEDYAEFPADPAPKIAADTERILARLGRELFAAVFGSRDAAAIWAQASLGGVDRLRVEVDADPGDVPGLPWELLRDPGTDRPLVVAAGEFVRTYRQTAITTQIPQASQERLRVLLVICRPGAGEDVPFRSVASRLVRGGADRLVGLELAVLRPATFARLREVLREARDRGRPFQVVHFDGHGTYLDVEHLATDEEAAGGVVVSSQRYGVSLAGPVRPGRHGYLLFEDPGSGSNQMLVDGPALAGLLVDTQVPVVVLNACRSAYAEAPDTPDPAEAGKGVHDRIRAYGSLAAEVADAGVPGVVAMRYTVYVVTAAQFVADLYTHLLAGRSLGRAATVARQALAADPTRRIGAEPVALQDWVVPTVYEATPLALHTPAIPAAVRITLSEPDAASGPTTGGGVPVAPDVGFVGRDESLLALDRAFDQHRVVLLHALAGAGKTSTAAEFARWYATTGGLNDPQVGVGRVVWTSFEHHLPLARVLDVVGTAFASLLADNGIEWAAVTDPASRRALVLQVLAAVPVLWVWDNVEPVAGFPPGTRSAWTPAEQQELLDFLRELKTTRVKVLLTSRRTEDSWLGGVATRVALPPMPMRERLQLAHELVRRLAPDGVVGREVDWRPLLRFTGGNPLTITVALRQALREHVSSTEAVGDFATRVRAGAAALEAEDDAALGRDRSLAASLDYGFRHAFTEAERARLAVLHLCRDTANIVALRAMGDPEVAGDDAVPGLAGADRDGLIGLLDRAVEVGLLTGYGGGYYGIHPAVPWFFAGLFTHHIGTPDSPQVAGAERAYARAYAAFGDHYAAQVEDGRSGEVLAVLRADEPNLTHGLDLARAHQLPDAGLGYLQGLNQLYKLTGREVEWARLVTQIEGDYLDPTTDQPLPGRRNHYGVITGYRARIAQARRDWPTATRLQTARTAWARGQAAPYQDLPADRLDPTARHHLRGLAVSENDLGLLLAEQDNPACLGHFQTAYRLFEKIGDTAGQAAQAGNLGNVYLVVTGLRDLDEAEHWHHHALNLIPEHNRVGRAAAHGSLATVAFGRFRDAPDRNAPEAELLAHLATAHTGYQRALDLLPADHHDHRATTHGQLGNIHAAVGEVPQALHHYQQAIHHQEARGDTYRAGNTRYNIALLLDRAGRPGDALHYARAALTNFRDVGPGATTETQQAQALINRLEQAISQEAPHP